MKNPKTKIFAPMLAFIMAFALAACSDNSNTHSGGNSTATLPLSQKGVLGESLDDNNAILDNEKLMEAFAQWTVEEDYATQENPEIEIFASWQEAYERVLREYVENSDLYFLLFDFEGDGTPELIVAGIYMDDVYDAVYAFRGDRVYAIQYDKNVFSADTVLYARGGIMPPPNNAEGLIHYVIGPSAGSFGTSWYYTKIIVDGDNLAIGAHGKSYVDVEALHQLFDHFGRDETDGEAMGSAIKDNTHYYINDDAVSMDELYSMFGHDYENGESRQLIPSRITESNIRDIIFAAQ